MRLVVLSLCLGCDTRDMYGARLGRGATFCVRVSGFITDWPAVVGTGEYRKLGQLKC